MAVVPKDSDGLTNLEEYSLGLNATNGDTDNVGLGDGIEVNEYGTDPSDSDSDSDGINDYEEIETLVNNWSIS